MARRHLPTEAWETGPAGLRAGVMWFCTVDLDKLEMQRFALGTQSRAQKGLQRAESRPRPSSSTVTGATVHTSRSLPLSAPRAPPQQDAKGGYPSTAHVHVVY